MRTLNLLALLFGALLFPISPASSSDCSSCGPDQKVKLQLRGIAKLAGFVEVRVLISGNLVDSFTLTGAPVVWNGSYYAAVDYQCVEWPRNVTAEAAFDEPILIEYHYSDDDQNPAYTEFDPDAVFEGVQANPVVFMRRPSATCPSYFFDENDENWVEDTALFSTDGNKIRIKVKMQADAHAAGESSGFQAGIHAPEPDKASYTDSVAFEDNEILAKCPEEGAGAMMASPASGGSATQSPSTGKKQLKSGIQILAAPFSQASGNTVDSTDTAEGAPQGASAMSLDENEPIASTTSTPYALTDQIGSLRWQMSLGSLQHSQTLGHLIYQSGNLAVDPLHPRNLSIARGSDPRLVLKDVDSNLMQIEMTQHLVDIQSTPTELRIRLFSSSQISGFDNASGRYLLSGDPSLVWTITSPSSGSILFTKTEGSETEEHSAQWQGTVGVSGTMTTSRYGNKWKEERTYSMSGDGTQRTEVISKFKNNALQYKVREVYQKFYNWGQPGEIFEGMVQKVEDPDGQALTTTYEYWDNAGLPGKLLHRVTHPDGFREWMPTRVGIGGGSPPVYTEGDLMRLVESFKDQNPTTTTGRMRYTQNQYVSPTQLFQTTTTTVNGFQVGYREVYHDFSSGSWLRQTYDSADETGKFSYREEWINPGNKETLFILETDGTCRTFAYDRAFWDPSTQTFEFGPGPGRVAARRTRVTHGTSSAVSGIPFKTLITQRVNDAFGRTVLEESYINTGSGISPANLVDRTVHEYQDGLLVETVRNGRITYAAQYDSHGDLEWEENEAGQRTEFEYDELERVSRRIVRGRGGDLDKTISLEYDVLGKVIREEVTAGGLTTVTSTQYNLAGEIATATGIDGLATNYSHDYSAGYKVTTETLPTQATRATSHFKDRQIRSVTGTAVEDLYFNPFIALWTTTSYREAVSIYRDSALTSLKQTRLINWLGNEVMVQTKQFQGAGNRNKFTTYDSAPGGQTRQLPVKIEETGRVRQLMEYDSLGQLTTQSLDMNNNSVIDAASTDRISLHDKIYSNSGGAWSEVQTVQRQLQDGVDAPQLAQRTTARMPASLAGNLVAWVSVERPGGGIVQTSTTLDRTTGTITTYSEDLELGQNQTRIERDGLLRSEASSGIAGSRSYTYTALGEVEVVNDPLNGSVTYAYEPATRRLVSVTDALNRQTQHTYYPAGTSQAGRLKGQRDPAGNWTYFEYTPAGQLLRQWGVNIYPEQYQYDEAGRATSLKTFRTKPGDVAWSSDTWPNPSGGDTTQWIYDNASELLARKVYADDTSVVLTYDTGNFLDTKTNARTQVLNFSFDLAGQWTGTTYTDGTPNVSLTYDRAGRTKTITDGSGTRTLSWTARDQPEDETFTAGELSGIVVDRGYDSKFRIAATELRKAGSGVLRQKITYDAISWVDYIADESLDGTTELHRFDYTFKPGTPYVQTVGFARTATPVMNQTYARDSLGRLTGAGASLAGGGPLRSVGYELDILNRRDVATWNDGTLIDYGYNDRSEVTAAKKKFEGGAFVGGSQYEFEFDDIGNRVEERFGGDAAGGNLRVTAYNDANALNQLTSRTPAGSIFITGEAETNLTLQGFADQSPFSLTRQQGESFFGEVELDNTAWSQYPKIKVVGKDGATVEDVVTGSRFLAQTPEAFQFDADGNRTSDARWKCSWDAENRLIQMETRPEAVSAGAPKQRFTFAYDANHRRYKRQAYVWNTTNGTYQLSETTYFVYDGWNLLAELDQSFAPEKTYQWGLDVSGTQQGAGGVGGLLSMKDVTTGQVYYYTYDGNGNVQQLVDSATSDVVAEYEYAPFGQITKAVGPLAVANRFRFSTKLQENESGWLYFGYRYLDVENGVWISRDPIGERGSANLSSFVSNRSVNKIDYLGLLTPGEFWDKWSQTQRRDWIAKFKNDLGKYIQEAATEQCVPAELLSAIIASEMIDIKWDEQAGEFLGVGTSFGPAQIQPRTVIREDAHDILDPNPPGLSIVPWPDEHEMREMLTDPRLNIRVAAKILKGYMNNLCDKAMVDSFSPSFRKNISGDCDLSDFCCMENKTCNEIVSLDVPACLIRSASAMWNADSDITKRKDILNDYPETLSHADEAGRLDGIFVP